MNSVCEQCVCIALQPTAMSLLLFGWTIVTEVAHVGPLFMDPSTLIVGRVNTPECNANA